MCLAIEEKRNNEELKRELKAPMPRVYSVVRGNDGDCKLAIADKRIRQGFERELNTQRPRECDVLRGAEDRH